MLNTKSTIDSQHIVRSQEQVKLGEVEIQSTNFLIDTSSINTKINYLVDNTVSKPKLVIGSLSGDVKDINDIVRVLDNSVIFDDYTIDQVSSALKLNQSIGSLKSLGLFIIGLLSFGSVSKNGKNKGSNIWIALLGGLLLFSSITYSINLSDVSIQVDILLPSSFKFDSLELKLGGGTSDIVGLVANSLLVDGCSSSKDHQITINQISVSSNLNICSSKDISISSLQLASSNVQVNLNSTLGINLNFFNGYNGSFKIKSNKLNIENGSACNIKTIGKDSEGSCGTQSKSNVIINSGLDTTISNVQSICPIDPKWRPNIASSDASVSPPISTVQPKTEYIYDKTNLVFMAQSLASSTSIIDGPSDVPNSFIINFASNAPNSNWLFAKSPTPSLRANTQYEFSLALKLGEPLNKYNVISSMTLYFYNPNYIQDPNGSNQYFKYSTRDPYFSKTFTGDFSSSFEFKTTSFIFTPTVDIGISVLGIQVNRTTKNGPSPTTIIISDMKLTIPSKNITTPTLLNQDSELVKIPKPSSNLDPQDTSTCPYKDSDLVHWHDPSIWQNGLVPLPSSSITLPEGKRVLISPCSISQQIYQHIKIPANSELIFADSDITLNVRDIHVLGKLTIGTKSCRYNAFINIVFHGNKTDQSTISQYYGSKGIGVDKGGSISIHGKQYHNTWTKLAATVWSGDNIIYVQDPVNYEVGQKVLITTSLFKDELTNQNEVLTISAIEGKRIQFTTPVKYYHYGGIEYQSEVALLSRRIVFNGDGGGLSDLESFGGHIIISGEGQLSGVQLIKMGQTNIKARYPLHFHLAGTVKNSYISDCSVVNSYYRCYTIHGTNNLTVERNVAFDVRGHCYYLEDGVEMDNKLLFNLASFIHPIGKPAGGRDQKGENFVQSSSLTQPADSTASGFYITNAWNTIIGNTCSGGWASFSFPNLPNPIGSFIDSPIIPQQYPTKEFEGNTGHSSGYFNPHSSSIYVGGYLYYNKNDGLLYYSSGRYSRSTYINGIAVEGNEAWMRFNNTKIWSSQRGIGSWGERIEIVGLEVYDSVRPASVFGESWIDSAIVNGRSGNILARGFEDEYTFQGFQWYDTNTKTILTNIVFRNYIHFSESKDVENDNRVFIGMTHSDEFKPQFMSIIKNITIQGTEASQYIGHAIVDTGSSRHFNFIDSDGSVFSTPAKGTPKIIGSHENWWNFDNSCNYNSDWNVYVCDKSQNQVVNIAPVIPNLIEPDLPLAETHIGNISLFGNAYSNSDRRTMTITKNPGITGVTGSNIGWYLYLASGSPTYMKIWVSQVPYGSFILFSIPYPAHTTFSISCDLKGTKIYNKNYTLGTSVRDVRDSDGSVYYFNGSHLYVKLVNLASKDKFFERGGTIVYDQIKYYFVHITASNSITPPSKSINGFYSNLPDVLPSFD